MTCYVRFASALAWHARQTALGLTAKGHECLLFCQRGSPLAEWTQDDPFAVDDACHLHRVSPAEIHCGLRRMRKAIREFRPEILNPHCPPGHSYLALVRRMERVSLPLIRTVAEPRYPKSNLVNRRLHERHTQGLIFTTESSARRYRESFDLSGVATQTILPGFDTRAFAQEVEPLPLRSQYGITDDRLIGAIVARMSPEKGQEVLIEALARLTPDERSRFFFVLTGDDTRERTQSDLRNLADSKGVSECIAFESRLPDVRPLMSAIDFGLVTSVRSEAVCRVALEYMSYSKPIVASDVNILPEVVRNGENGWVFANRDPQALAGCLRSLLESPSELWSRGDRGCQMVTSDFSLDEQTDHTLEFFQSLIP